LPREPAGSRPTRSCPGEYAGLYQRRRYRGQCRPDGKLWVVLPRLIAGAGAINYRRRHGPNQRQYDCFAILRWSRCAGVDLQPTEDQRYRAVRGNSNITNRSQARREARGLFPQPYRRWPPLSSVTTSGAAAVPVNIGASGTSDSRLINSRHGPAKPESGQHT